MLFHRDMLRKASDQHIHHKKSASQGYFLSFFFINQTSLVNIYAKNTANWQIRAGRDFFGGAQPVGRKK